MYAGIGGQDHSSVACIVLMPQNKLSMVMMGHRHPTGHNPGRTHRTCPDAEESCAYCPVVQARPYRTGRPDPWHRSKLQDGGLACVMSCELGQTLQDRSSRPLAPEHAPGRWFSVRPVLCSRTDLAGQVAPTPGTGACSRTVDQRASCPVI